MTAQKNILFQGTSQQSPNSPFWLILKIIYFAILTKCLPKTEKCCFECKNEQVAKQCILTEYSRFTLRLTTPFIDNLLPSVLMIYSYQEEGR